MNMTTKKYLSGWQNMGQRYGVTARNAQRMVLDGRLPEPWYMPGSRSPMWELDALDQHDRRTLVKRSQRRDDVTASETTEPEAA
jgi:hypothetical protein